MVSINKKLQQIIDSASPVAMKPLTDPQLRVLNFILKHGVFEEDTLMEKDQYLEVFGLPTKARIVRICESLRLKKILICEGQLVSNKVRYLLAPQIYEAVKSIDINEIFGDKKYTAVGDLSDKTWFTLDEFDDRIFYFQCEDQCFELFVNDSYCQTAVTGDLRPTVLNIDRQTQVKLLSKTAVAKSISSNLFGRDEKK